MQGAEEGGPGRPSAGGEPVLPSPPHHPYLPRPNLYLHPNPCPNPNPAQAESLTAALAELYIKTPDQLRTALDSEEVLGQVGANPDPNLNPPER